jgi:hypothetical protein
MNGKKVVVALLFVLTIIIGIAAIYFARTLGPKPTVTVTPTPSIVLTKTPKPTIDESLLTPIITSGVQNTPTKTTNIGSLTCGQTCDKGSCGDGYNCITINSIKKCVSNSCVSLQNQTYLPNGSCESDLCTILNEINIIKSSTISCVSGQDSRKISFNIKITNPVGIATARTEVSVFDVLNTNLLDSYIDVNSITNGGKLLSGQIKWDNLTLDANGGALELHYDAIVPNTENGKVFSNIVSVLELGIQKNQYNFEYTVNILPCTALITDEVDRILLGVIMLIFGIFIYKMNWHYTIGQYFWKNGGKNSYRVSSNVINKIYLDITQKGNKKFERKLIQRDKVRKN